MNAKCSHKSPFKMRKFILLAQITALKEILSRSDSVRFIIHYFFADKYNVVFLTEFLIRKSNPDIALKE